VREGDTLVVWRLDRLGRSLKHLIETISLLDARKIGFRSLTENIDTTTSGGKLIFHIFGALAEFERNLIRERTNAGLQAARARGRKGGPKPKVTPEKIAMAQELYNNKKKTVKEISTGLGMSRATFYRYVQTEKTLNEEQLYEEPVSVGIRDVNKVAHPLFCSYHDESIFRPLEKSAFSFQPEQILLLAYRALSSMRFGRLEVSAIDAVIEIAK